MFDGEPLGDFRYKLFHPRHVVRLDRGQALRGGDFIAELFGLGRAEDLECALGALPRRHCQGAAHINEALRFGVGIRRATLQRFEQTRLQLFAPHRAHHRLREIGDLRREADIVESGLFCGPLNRRRKGLLVALLRQLGQPFGGVLRIFAGLAFVLGAGALRGGSRRRGGEGKFEQTVMDLLFGFRFRQHAGQRILHQCPVIVADHRHRARGVQRFTRGYPHISGSQRTDEVGNLLFHGGQRPQPMSG